MAFGFPFVIGAHHHDGNIGIRRKLHSIVQFIWVLWGAHTYANCTKASTCAHAGLEPHGYTLFHGDAMQLLFTTKTKIFTTTR